MARLGWAEEVLFRRLMSVVDDYGRYYADHGLLRAACYPRQLSKVSDSDIGKWLTALVEAALVRVYRAEDRESYLEVLDFRQQVRAKESKFPSPTDVCIADATQVIGERIADAHLDVSVFGDVFDNPPTPRKRGVDGVGRFPEFWSRWPKNERKQDKAKCLDHWKRNGLDSLADSILRDIGVKANTDKWRGGYVEAPLVYLRGRRWEDGVEPAGPAPVSAPAAESVEAYQARMAAERKAERERLAQQAGPPAEVKAKIAELRGLRVAQ